MKSIFYTLLLISLSVLSSRSLRSNNNLNIFNSLRLYKDSDDNITIKPTSKPLDKISSAFTDTFIDKNKLCNPTKQIEFDSILPNYNNGDILINYFLSFMITIIYIPQYYYIINKKSTHGISMTSVFLVALNNLILTWSTLIVNYDLLRSCNIISTNYCIPYVQSFMQAFLGISIILPLYVIMLITYSYYDSEHETEGKTFEASNLKILGLSKIVFTESTLFFTFVLIISLISGLFIKYLGLCQNFVLDYAVVLGVFVSIIQCVQWLPQIFYTLTIQKSGSLSKLTILGFILCDVLSLLFSIRRSVSWYTCVAIMVDIVVLVLLMGFLINFRSDKKYSLIKLEDNTDNRLPPV